jgi:hypothetical protein
MRGKGVDLLTYCVYVYQIIKPKKMRKTGERVGEEEENIIRSENRN